MKTSNEKILFAVYTQELKKSDGWKVLEKELERAIQVLENRILNQPLEQADHTPRYTKTDLEREVRKILKMLAELPENILRNLQEITEDV